MMTNLPILSEKSVSTDMRSAMSAARIDGNDSSLTILHWLARAGELLPAWWSQNRDTHLRKFWLGSDILSGAMYSVVSRTCAIPCRVEARDMNVQSHQELAALYSDLLFKRSQLLQGWSALMEHAMQDYLGQDNGMFIEVLGPGDPSGPIRGAPISLYHRDASRCIRTADPEFPVVYNDRSGKRYKMHYSRIIYASQLPSANNDMNGVGFCAVSRCVNAAQNLMDVARYKQEKLGSRPPRQIILGKGISAKDIGRAFVAANAQMSAENLSVFSKTVVLGANDSNVGLELFDLASVPDGFDENTATNLGVYIVALAFGTDARDFWPATSSGATKADAMVQHMKARGKGSAQILQTLTEQLENKFLPDELKLVFDLQDDEEDEMQANIRSKRAVTRKVDLDDQVTSLRVAREHSLRDNDMSQEQFEELELADGRLPDGMPVLTLFYSKDPLVQELLKLPVPEPMSLILNKPEKPKEPEFYMTPAPPKESRFGESRGNPKPRVPKPMFSKPNSPKSLSDNNEDVVEEDGTETVDPKLKLAINEAIMNAQRRVVWASTARIKRTALQCLGALQEYKRVLCDDVVEPPDPQEQEQGPAPDKNPPKEDTTNGPEEAEQASEEAK